MVVLSLTINLILNVFFKGYDFKLKYFFFQVNQFYEFNIFWINGA